MAYKTCPFLPTQSSGLDDLSCSQCISLLQRIAHAGRTVICSIHTPSAKIFEMFDHVYVLAAGQCVYQGQGANMVNYLHTTGLNCPLTYNPVDFSKCIYDWKLILFDDFTNKDSSLAVIEVASGEYGHEYVDKMISLVDNGRCLQWTPEDSIEPFNNRRNERYIEQAAIEEFEEDIDPKLLKPKSSNWHQFCILFKRRTKQMWRDSVRIDVQQRHLCTFNAIFIRVVNSNCNLPPIAELYETSYLYDRISRRGSGRHLPGHWKRCIQSTIQFWLLFYCNNSVHV